MGVDKGGVGGSSKGGFRKLAIGDGRQEYVREVRNEEG